MPKLEVGQKLWYVPNRQGFKPEWVTVKEVGRKWATIDEDHHRVDIETLELDGTGFGRCYLDREEYDAEALKNRTFTQFVRNIRYVANPGVTLADIQEAARLLKVELG